LQQRGLFNCYQYDFDPSARRFDAMPVLKTVSFQGFSGSTSFLFVHSEAVT
jgi:hypothetical protein